MFYALHAQTVSDYFVSEKGTVWKYDVFPLDSLQNKIIPTKPTYEYTKLLGISPILNKDLFLFHTARTFADNVPVYLDTIAYETFPKPFSQYFSFKRIISGTPFDTFFIGSLDRFSNWYRMMNLNGTVNTPDTLLRFDTTLTVDTLSLPLQFIFTTTKRNERKIILPAGIFSALPFAIRFRTNLRYTVPILGTISIPIIDVTDTMYIAKGKWIVKEIMQSTTVPAPSPFSQLLPPEIPRFNILGFVKELAEMKITFVASKENNPSLFILDQNYPNPFNPTTTITYTVGTSEKTFQNNGERVFTRSNNTFVVLKIYDIVGREIATLVNETKVPGNYSVKFSAQRVESSTGGGSAFGGDGKNLPSGLYFYTLHSGSFWLTKKMILQK